MMLKILIIGSVMSTWAVAAYLMAWSEVIRPGLVKRQHWLIWAVGLLVSSGLSAWWLL